MIIEDKSAFDWYWSDTPPAIVKILIKLQYQILARDIDIEKKGEAQKVLHECSQYTIFVFLQLVLIYPLFFFTLFCFIENRFHPLYVLILKIKHHPRSRPNNLYLIIMITWWKSNDARDFRVKISNWCKWRLRRVCVLVH